MQIAASNSSDFVQVQRWKLYFVGSIEKKTLDICLKVKINKSSHKPKSWESFVLNRCSVSFLVIEASLLLKMWGKTYNNKPKHTMYHCMTNKPKHFKIYTMYHCKTNKPKHFKSPTMYYCMTNDTSSVLSVWDSWASYWLDICKTMQQLFNLDRLIIVHCTP